MHRSFAYVTACLLVMMLKMRRGGLPEKGFLRIRTQDVDDWLAPNSAFGPREVPLDQ